MVAIEIEEARGQPPEAAIAEPGIGFLLDQAEPVQAALVRRALDERLAASGSLTLFVERPADQELHRHVVDALGVLLIVGASGLDPAPGEEVADRAGRASKRCRS